jgi:phage recombination protein Bet
MAKAVAKVEEAAEDDNVIHVAQPAPRRSIIETMAAQYGMETKAFQATVIATCFPANPAATMEEFAAGMQVAHKLGLNPLTKEVHFARTKGGGIQAIIGVDGWYAMANRHPEYDGCEFKHEWSIVKDAKKEPELVSITCRIFRKDRNRPMEVTEYMHECRRQSEAWKLTPSRMLRHRAFGQCARVAFSFAGIMDQDEFARWEEHENPPPRRKSSAAGKRDGDDETFKAIMLKLENPADATDCGETWKANAEWLSTAPSRWYTMLLEAYVMSMKGFGVEVDIDAHSQELMRAAE